MASNGFQLTPASEIRAAQDAKKTETILRKINERILTTQRNGWSSIVVSTNDMTASVKAALVKAGYTIRENWSDGGYHDFIESYNVEW